MSDNMGLCYIVCEWKITKQVDHNTIILWYDILSPEAATQRCSKEKVFWKFAANLQENTHAEVWFQ